MPGQSRTPIPGTPLVWSPHGASDTLDSSTAPSGAMASLQDLIPDPSTKDLWQCRPAAIRLTAFGTFNTPTFISCMRTIGTRIYGMVSTAATPGHDEPFAYDIPSNTFIAITGVTPLNTPVSPATSGVWTPPNLDLVGSKIIVTHPGFTGAAGAFFGVIDVTNPAAPTWAGTNTAPVALVAVPQWVVNFNGRAFFLVNPSGSQPAAYMSDSLNPTVITNANQILTFGDNVPLTCAAGLALLNQLGGILQSLMIFKGQTNIYQVTGDYALSNLSINTLNIAAGTLAPNTVQPTSKGLVFADHDGLRLIDFNAKVSDPIGNSGDGVCVPFVFSLIPSRMCASYNGGVYRLQLQNGNAVGSPQQQWWYDFVRNIWSGPHTQAASLMVPYAGNFIVTLQTVGASLWQSDVVQSTTSTYVENGRQLQFNFTTPMLPDTDQMAEVAMVETTVHMALTAGNNITCTAQDQSGTVLDTVIITPVGSPTIWGAFIWGAALWQGLQNMLYPRQLAWHFPIVFRRMGLMVIGASAQGFKIGRVHLRYQVLGYLQQG